MNRRRGYTLIEILVVLATSGALLAVGLGVLHLLVRLEHDARDEVRQQTTLDHLADQFRRDAHAAVRLAGLEAPQRDDPPRGWQFSLGESRAVQYRAERGELVRTESVGDDVIRRESFVVPAEATVSIELAGEAPGIVRLRIIPEGTQPPALWRGTCVDAELAKDRRFLQ
jgi:prepilin-type N-terminal cleavage/methylation domain-containing protein